MDSWEAGMTRSLGDAHYHRLLPAMRSFHAHGGHVEGIFHVKRSPGFFVNLLAWLGGLPPVTAPLSPLRPSETPSPGVERSQEKSLPPTSPNEESPKVSKSPPSRVTVFNNGKGVEDRLFFSVDAPYDQKKAHRFVSCFYVRPNSNSNDPQQQQSSAFYENVLGGLLRFEFQHRAGNSTELLERYPHMIDIAECEELFSQLPSSLLPNQKMSTTPRKEVCRGGDSEMDRSSPDSASRESDDNGLAVSLASDDNTALKSPFCFPSSTSSCLAREQPNVYGWYGYTTGMYALFGWIPLQFSRYPCTLTTSSSSLLAVENVTIPHADGKGWFVSVQLRLRLPSFFFFSCYTARPVGRTKQLLLTSYAGHVRVVPQGGDEKEHPSHIQHRRAA